MKSQLTQEFSNGVLRGYFPSTAEGEVRASSISWDSPRLNVTVPYDDRPAGSDRAICRTVNGIICVKFIDKAIFQRNGNGPAAYPIITAGLYGEANGIVGALSFKQLYTIGYNTIGTWPLALYNSNGDVGFNFFSSYANLMQNIFMRVTIVRKAADAPYTNDAVPIDAVCSGVLLAADPR